MNFWKQLEKPFFAVAPMEDVTDAAFRYIIAKYSKSNGGKYVTFTEFISADGLVFADEKGIKKLLAKLRFTENERPVVAQLFTATPSHMKAATRIVAELGFDGVDINMGCPDKSVEKQGAGAALIQNPTLAIELICAARDGIHDAKRDIPISVKTRIGYNKNELETWLPVLLEQEPAVVTIHARTRNELSNVPADWNTIRQAVEIRDKLKSKTLIVGNGDVASVSVARKRATDTLADGVMIGRGAFGNPWVMSDYKPTIEEKLLVLIEHTHKFEKEFTDIKSFATMRKHFSSYVGGFSGAKELRIKLMECNNAGEVEAIITRYIHTQLHTV